MNADRLLAHYERIAEAPDAIKRLRRFVLDLAVRGKLVAQDADDEPASELLKRIAAEKARLVKVGEIKKPKASIPLDPEDTPFDLPCSWQWVRLADMLTKLTDGTHHSPPNEKEGEILYITAKNIKHDGVDIDDVTYVSRKVHDEIYARCNPQFGDILYIKDGATAGIVTINNLDQPFSMLSSVALLKLPRCLFNQLIVVFLRSPFFYEQMRSFMKGAAIPRVTLKRMGPALVPLPPLAEQHRIVAKVDELMALCDQLEAARAERETVRDRMAAASLARLTAPDADPAAFQAHATFTLDNLTPLTTCPDQIKPLRQTILNLAVLGKLVEQNPADNQKNQSALRTDKQAESYDRRAFEERAAKFDLPSNWTIEPLSRVAERIVDCPHTTPEWTEGGVLCIKTNQVRAGILDLSSPTFVSEETYRIRIERLEPRADDILYIREGGVLGVGCRIPPNTRLCMGQRLMLIRANASVAPVFLELCLNSPWVADFAAEKTTGGAAPRVNMSLVRGYPIPLPPLAEQHRIVAKVDALMTLCDRLEAALTTADTTRARLLEALLHEALDPAAEAVTEAAE